MGKNSILIVDDDLILLKTAEEILSSIYTVSVAKSGKQAITLLKKGVVPDLILLDIAMPEMDGYTTLEKMKSIPNCQDIPVIFLTGFAESDYEVKGLKAGAVDYIVKPFVKEVLLARVEMHLERSAKETGKSFAESFFIYSSTIFCNFSFYNTPLLFYSFMFFCQGQIIR